MNSLISDEQFIDLYNYLADDERFGSGPTRGRVACDHTLHYTIEWMKKQQIQDVRANVEKIIDLGGHCDCEVLLNVDPDIWEERKYEEIAGPGFMEEGEWEQFVTDTMHASGFDESEEV